jgi:hypothetical protein
MPSEEIQRRQERKAKLAAARAEIEARARARAAAEMAEYKAKLEERGGATGSRKKAARPGAQGAEPATQAR